MNTRRPTANPPERKRRKLPWLLGPGVLMIFLLPVVLIAGAGNQCSPTGGSAFAGANGPIASGHGGFEETAYGPPWDAMNGTGQTAYGPDLTAGQPMLEIAIDPTVLTPRGYYHVWPNPFSSHGAFWPATPAERSKANTSTPTTGKAAPTSSRGAPGTASTSPKPPTPGPETAPAKPRRPPVRPPRSKANARNWPGSRWPLASTSTRSSSRPASRRCGSTWVSTTQGPGRSSRSATASSPTPRALGPAGGRSHARADMAARLSTGSPTDLTAAAACSWPRESSPPPAPANRCTPASRSRRSPAASRSAGPPAVAATARWPPPSDSNAPAISGCHSTACGENMSQLIHALGGPAGIPQGPIYGNGC